MYVYGCLGWVSPFYFMTPIFMQSFRKTNKLTLRYLKANQRTTDKVWLHRTPSDKLGSNIGPDDYLKLETLRVHQIRTKNICICMTTILECSSNKIKREDWKLKETDQDLLFTDTNRMIQEEYFIVRLTISMLALLYHYYLLSESSTGPAEHCAGGSRPRSCNSCNNVMLNISFTKSSDDTWVL